MPLGTEKPLSITPFLGSVKSQSNAPLPASRNLQVKIDPQKCLKMAQTANPHAQGPRQAVLLVEGDSCGLMRARSAPHFFVSPLPADDCISFLSHCFMTLISNQQPICGQCTNGRQCIYPGDVAVTIQGTRKNPGTFSFSSKAQADLDR